ncbi:hypothetical protein ACSBR2_010118 [Camellia fascicularis]
MAGANGSSLLQTFQQKQTLDCLFTSLDPKSLILSQFGNDQKPNLLQLTTESFVMERGPRYKAYAELRESNLRKKNIGQQQQQQTKEHESNLSPPKKQVKIQGNFPATPPNKRRGSSVVAQSVPDFSAALRKENRKPASMLPPLMEKSLTPPVATKNSKLYGAKSGGGSKSANLGEKRNGGLMGRKSYASMEELKGLSSAAANAINGENRGGRGGRGVAKTVLGYRQY